MERNCWEEGWSHGTATPGTVGEPEMWSGEGIAPGGLGLTLALSQRKPSGLKQKTRQLLWGLQRKGELVRSLKRNTRHFTL